MALLKFKRVETEFRTANGDVQHLLRNFSIEVMPRTAEKIGDFRELLPENTRVYVAHIDGTPIEDMVATARRLTEDGFQVMPHFPARIIANKSILSEWIERYQNEAGVTQALLLAGGVADPRGVFENSMHLLETGLFDKFGFTRLHVAGHPEGNKDIDPKGGTENVEKALSWKNDFDKRTDAEMAIVTQFSFEPAPIIRWANAVKESGIHLPIHIGVAGPAKLQTLIKFAIACGVGPSLRVLQKRAMDVTKLVMPYEPTELVQELAEHKTNHPAFPIENVHFFPLGGIKTCAEWALAHGNLQPAEAAQ